MKDADQATDPLEDIALVPEPSEKLLNERQYLDYRSEREHCLDWLLTFGKEPEKAEGYAKATVKNRASRMDQFYRWVWEQEDGYTTNLTHDHGDGYLRQLAPRVFERAQERVPQGRDDAVQVAASPARGRPVGAEPLVLGRHRCS